MACPWLVHQLKWLEYHLKTLFSTFTSLDMLLMFMLCFVNINGRFSLILRVEKKKYKIQTVHIRYVCVGVHMHACVFVSKYDQRENGFECVVQLQHLMRLFSLMGPCSILGGTLELQPWGWWLTTHSLQKAGGQVPYQLTSIAWERAQPRAWPIAELRRRPDDQL